MALWHIWVLAALVFMIIEIFTAGFAVACFSFGCLASALCAGLDLDIWWQVLAFAVVSGIAFVTVRPLVLKYFFRKSGEVRTNADAVIGRQARVTEAIDPAAGTGRVAIDGDDWKAVTEDGSTVEAGATVVVVSRESIILTVKTL